MTTTINDDLVIGGAFSAANFIFGSATINAQTNAVASSEVTGLNHTGTAEPTVILTAHSAYPWSRVQEVGYRFSTPTGFTMYMYRTSDVDTIVHYLSWQEYTP